MVTPINTTLIQALYAQQPGTTSSNPFVNVYDIRDPTVNDINYPIQKRWINFNGPKEWILENFNSSSGFPLANWILLASGSSLAITLTGNTGGPVPPTLNNINVVGDGVTITIAGNPGTSTLTASLIGAGASVTKIGMQTGTSPVVPDGTGLITFNGATVVAGTNPVRTDGTGANTMALEVQLSQDSPISDPTLVGLASFNDAQFIVDANGFVTIIGGGGPLDSIQVDAFTPPGTQPVIADGTGKITITGGQVAASVVGTNVIRTDSLAANTFTIEIQRSQAVASSTLADNGVSHFDSAFFLVDANGFVSTTAFNQPGVANLGITQTAGTTFTVTSANGTALSATNPGYVTLQSLANPGRLITYKITANQSFTQANISANTWGITSGVDWAQDMPFYLYAVSNANAGENTIAFMISRIPHRTIAPLAANIAKQGSAVATTQGSFYALPNITVADYASSPCLLIGSFRMRYAAAGTTWTIQTLNNSDGIGQFNDANIFIMPSGQNGAAAGKFFKNNGGTAPSFTGSVTFYKIQKDGSIKVEFDGNNAVGDGAGAVNLILALPLTSIGNTFGTGYYLLAGAATTLTFQSDPGGSSESNHIYFVAAAASGTLQNLNYGAAQAGTDTVANLYYIMTTA